MLRTRARSGPLAGFPQLLAPLDEGEQIQVHHIGMGGSFRELPTFLVTVGIMAASHALGGRVDDAQRAMRNLRQLDPSLRLSGISDWLPFQRPQDLAIFTDGLRQAGLPE